MILSFAIPSPSTVLIFLSFLLSASSIGLPIYICRALENKWKRNDQEGKMVLTSIQIITLQLLCVGLTTFNMIAIPAMLRAKV